MKLLDNINRSNKISFTLPSVSLIATFLALPAHAEDKNQRDALLEAALQRISALEAKVGRINALEDENRQLKTKLVRVETKSDTAMKVSAKSLASAKVDNKPTVLAYASSPASNNSDLIPKRTLWEGAYAGINAGYGTNNIKNYINTTEVTRPGGNIEALSNSYETSYIGGAVAGGQFGYNHVFANHILIGAEADINWADVYNNANPTNSAAFSIGHTNPQAYQGLYEIDTSFAPNYRRVGMDWVGTVRARLGYDMGKFLPYVTGGLAYGGLGSDISNAEYGVAASYGAFVPPQIPTAEVGPNGTYTKGSSSAINAGWVLGAGAEYMVTDGWSIKGEYLYTSIGGVVTPLISQSIEPSDTKAFTTENTGSFGVHQARVGLNYHPGWSFSEPVLAAKY
jgi:outer membrane immunogenic protein